MMEENVTRVVNNEYICEYRIVPKLKKNDKVWFWRFWPILIVNIIFLEFDNGNYKIHQKYNSSYYGQGSKYKQNIWCRMINPVNKNLTSKSNVAEKSTQGKKQVLKKNFPFWKAIFDLLFTFIRLASKCNFTSFSF